MSAPADREQCHATGWNSSLGLWIPRFVRLESVLMRSKFEKLQKRRSAEVARRSTSVTGLGPYRSRSAVA